jgi:alcohol dehydrogenase
MGRVIANELVLYGSHGIAASSYPEVFDFIATRGVPLDRLVGPRLGLDAAPAHLASMDRHSGVGMAIVDPGR